MDEKRKPKPGEIYNHFKDKPYQIITVATHTETGELMVVYQALYGDFKTYVRSLVMFLSEVDHVKYPEVKQKYRFELRTEMNIDQVIEPTKVETVKPDQIEDSETAEVMKDLTSKEKENPEESRVNIAETSEEEIDVTPDSIVNVNVSEGTVNETLLKFLDAESYNRKLEVITSNMKHLNNRLINDMAVSLDCAVDEGPLDQRIQGLIFCLQAMSRFEDRRLR